MRAEDRAADQANDEIFYGNMKAEIEARCLIPDTNMQVCKEYSRWETKRLIKLLDDANRLKGEANERTL